MRQIYNFPNYNISKERKDMTLTKCDKCHELDNNDCGWIKCSSSTVQGISFKLCQKCSLEAQELLVQWSKTIWKKTSGA